ncbi:hypothetical protein ACFL0D_05835 [Thermoproteota archaeon]
MAAQKDKITWIICPDCGGKIGIVISVDKTDVNQVIHQEPRETVEEWPPQTAHAMLQAAGIDVSQLDIEENETMIAISPKKFLGDLWGPINDKIRELGGNWIRDGRNSRWELGKESLNP